jgi:thiosulfate/3-mercaptopyruvate sulfurtransferase
MGLFHLSRRNLATSITTLAIAGLLPLSVASTASASTEITLVSPADASANVNSGKWKVLDVRPVPPLDYLSGHLPKAVHISEQAFRGPNGTLPYQIWPAGDLANLLSKAGVSNKDSVIVYSDGTNVLGATLVAYILEKSGVPKVAILDGGFSGYKAAELPTTKRFPNYKIVPFKTTSVNNISISLKELLPLVGKPNVVIVDPRPKAQYEGTDQTFIRNGHIPGAINIAWQSATEAKNPAEALQNPHKFKSVEALRKLFESRGVTPDKTVIISCSTGREASLQYVVLKHLLGYPNVRVYEGSWTEYSATNYPVQTGPDPSVKN